MPNIDNGSVQERDKDWRWWDQRGDQNFVKDPNMFRSDIDLQRRIFWNACEHSGFKVEYFEAEFEREDFYRDKVVKWKESAILPCIFDDSKNIKVLKNLGWYIADQEIQPTVLYLSVYRKWESKEILDLKDQSLFRISYFGQNYPVDFRLTDKKLDSVYGVYWICKLAPEHLDNFYYVTDHGTHFLKKKEDTKVTCEHQHGEKGEESKRDSRIYQHEDIEKYLFGKKGEEVSDQRPYDKSEFTNSNQDIKTYSQLIMEDDD